MANDPRQRDVTERERWVVVLAAVAAVLVLALTFQWVWR
jgi:hypothetical protein